MIDAEITKKIAEAVAADPNGKTLVSAICANGYALVPEALLEQFPEINPSNYDHDDACALNAWGVEVVNAATR